MENARGEIEGGDHAGGGGGSTSSSAPDRHVIRWESFLPRRSLRVLLVEHDDSTRHVVTALLRKCSYRVAGVADGMKAWEVMREKRYRFDLVLTEVETPTLSGIGLLSKMMSTEEYKNMPVIMMSAHDSVNVVLKCMLKGAVDFLVKPVRKNELRNLWQHVWRRHCSDRYMDNNTASNQISANAGGGSKTGENSDERNDAQSLGSKHDTEIDSAQRHGEHPQPEQRFTSLGEANQVHSDKDAAIEASASKMDAHGHTREYKHVDTRINVTLPILESSVANATQELNFPHSNLSEMEESLNLVRSAKDNYKDSKSCSQNNTPNESGRNMILLVEPMSNAQCSYAVLQKECVVENSLYTCHAKDVSLSGTSSSLEISLRRPQPSDCMLQELKEKHVLKHSVASAFSRYSDKKIQSTFQKPVSSSLCVVTEELVDKCHSFVSSHDTDGQRKPPSSHTEKNLPSSQGNGNISATVYVQAPSSDKDNGGLHSLPPTENESNEGTGNSPMIKDTNNHHAQFGFIPLPIPIGMIPYQNLCVGYGGILQPVFYPEASLAPQSSAADEKVTLELTSGHSVYLNNQLVSHSPSLEFHHREETDHHGHWRRAINISEAGGSGELLRNPPVRQAQSSICGQDVPMGSASNCNGKTADRIGNACSGETADRVGNALESRNECGVQNFNGKDPDSDRARREAALMKFRLKRKDRCFEKKVRYYNRKKLAEQRPRIKGQFVRQKVADSSTELR